jgi:hypothetical protein
VKPTFYTTHPSRTPSPSSPHWQINETGNDMAASFPSPPLTTTSPAAHPTYSTTPFPLLVPPQVWIGFWLDVPIRPCVHHRHIFCSPCLEIVSSYFVVLPLLSAEPPLVYSSAPCGDSLGTCGHLTVRLPDISSASHRAAFFG